MSSDYSSTDCGIAWLLLGGAHEGLARLRLAHDDGILIFDLVHELLLVRSWRHRCMRDCAYFGRGVCLQSRVERVSQKAAWQKVKREITDQKLLSSSHGNIPIPSTHVHLPMGSWSSAART
jgi:hypothetical protein